MYTTRYTVHALFIAVFAKEFEIESFQVVGMHACSARITAVAACFAGIAAACVWLHLHALRAACRGQAGRVAVQCRGMNEAGAAAQIKGHHSHAPIGIIPAAMLHAAAAL
jgi:hypothetical protein